MPPIRMGIPAESVTISPHISEAWTLAAQLYIDPAVFALEKDRIFTPAWQAVGHCAQAASPGDFFTTELLGEPLLFARGADGKLRAFYNVCRHRAGPPAAGCGSRKVFRCAYHGWTYGLEGELISAPEFEGLRDFRAGDFALRPVRTEEWSNLIFVNLDPAARPLVESLGQLPRQTSPFAFERLRLFERRGYDMKCNWKTYVDNYLEGYHLPSVHPGLNRELDYSAYVVEPYAGHVRQFSPIRGAQPGDAEPRRYQDGCDGLTSDYFWVFPNWMLNCYPDNVSLNMVLPLDAERSLAIFEWYLPEERLNSPAARAVVDFSDQIQKEDITICESVQKNLHSRSYSRGRFSVKQEKGVHAFHRMYGEIMRDASAG
jgi:choline monooxygenase